MKAFLTTIFSIVLLTGCSSIRPDDPYGRYMPRKPKWQLISDNPDPEGVIRYDCVYVGEYRFPRYGTYVVRRFWPTGQMMQKLVDDVGPNVADSYESATVGYFQVINRKIMTEVFVSINFGQYGYGKGYIDDDGSIVLVSGGPNLRDQRNKYDPPMRLVPMEVGELTLQPDW